MKITFSIFLIILVFIMIHSCERKEDIKVFAGKKDNLYYVDFEPDIILNYQKLSDSLDLNNDSFFDIIFEQFRIPTSTGFTTIPVIKTLNNVQIVISETNSLIDTLNYAVLIDESKNWSNIEDTFFMLIDYKKGQWDNYVPYGNWLEAEDKFLGIKYDKKFGWIKISNFCMLKKEMIIKEFALEN